ncbi:MAG: 2-hydroxychromene-2-carboxylate isomerase [Parvularculaceae bacterium]|nr:2-hydroxychromene-2-carboxylate isomerase [Parvularculaceae bacterium]
MTEKTVEFLFDFGSPNAYFSWRVLPQIAERAGATIVPTPVLLGGIFKATNNQSPMMAFGNVQGKLAYEQIEIQRFIKKHQLTEFQFNPNFPVNTLHLMRGAVYAAQQGFMDAYLSAGFKAMWEQGLKMDDPEVFTGALDAAGLDGAAIFAGTQDAAVKDGLKQNTENAVARGVFGIPTFFVGDEMFFGKDRLGQVEDELNAEG